MFIALTELFLPKEVRDIYDGIKPIEKQSFKVLEINTK